MQDEEVGHLEDIESQNKSDIRKLVKLWSAMKGTSKMYLRLSEGKEKQ
jgi:hypothetical protein